MSKLLAGLLYQAEPD